MLQEHKHFKQFREWLERYLLREHFTMRHRTWVRRCLVIIHGHLDVYVHRRARDLGYPRSRVYTSSWYNTEQTLRLLRCKILKESPKQ